MEGGEIEYRAAFYDDRHNRMKMLSNNKKIAVWESMRERERELQVQFRGGREKGRRDWSILMLQFQFHQKNFFPLFFRNSRELNFNWL